MNMQEMMDQKVRKLMEELAWKQCHKFARKWNLATICIADPDAVRSQLENDFRAAHPDLDFDEEWSKCLKELPYEGEKDA